MTAVVIVLWDKGQHRNDISRKAGLFSGPFCACRLKKIGECCDILDFDKKVTLFQSHCENQKKPSDHSGDKLKRYINLRAYITKNLNEYAYFCKYVTPIN